MYDTPMTAPTHSNFAIAFLKVNKAVSNLYFTHIF